MLLIDCPHCGARDETEFSYGGEAHIMRPLAENEISDAELRIICFCVIIQKVFFSNAGVIVSAVGDGSMWPVTL